MRFTEEHKRKLSLARKGKIPWNKGLTIATDFRIKSSWNKGLTKETNESVKKTSNALLGFKHTEETRKKISLASKGRVGWNLGLTKETDKRIAKQVKEKIGYKHKEESKRLMSENNYWNNSSKFSKKDLEKTKKEISKVHKGTKHSLETRKKISEGNKGKKYSEETKRKMSVSAIKRIQSHKGLYKDTKPELNVKFLLELYDISYLHQYRVKNRLYDFYLIDYNYLIEVDGIYWHGKLKGKNGLSTTQLRNIENDKYKTKLARQEGYKLKRVWNDEIDKFERWLEKNLFKMELIRKEII